ncbi:pimeloyl-ACP methyl ester carboxylesterase [Arthrobacter sp. V4I6]|uniref:alpha/beta fold hydrolase n=1 Tax=unclassified Arthrobacter TaxID=235627 RepID=UPI0027809D92|nr:MULTISPECIES: alpha/beta fold hydrolase [unclassified Arthrobacter]MDQ0819646.1 pimeloyl-ACP methyl ester carboxylesterase [Arthrobacter sp. V1I7]MDQ0853826.1 pimeloyl-ACP methyl ester carboxylesterase [Arthrobacter sp. V4I6]
MIRPVRSEIEAAGHLGHVYASRRPLAQAAGGDPDAAQSGPAVVLVHGIGVSHRYLRRLHRALAASVDTYSIDLPGFGATPRPDHTLPVADHASYILGAMEQLGVLDFVIVGHSMGVQFAIDAALQQPGRIPYLVLMGPVVDSNRPTVAQQALALGRDSLFFESPSSNAVVFSDYLRCGPGWYLKNLRVMMDYPTEQRIAEVAAPVLVVRGAHDPVASADWCRRLAGRAAMGRLVEIQGTGHVAQHNRSAEVAEAILSFAGLPKAASKASREFKA